MRRTLLLGITFFVFTLSHGQESAEKPNFLFILVDDLGWKDLGCYGSTFYETPHIDSLAATGTRFTNAYAACPVCSPTRASIMTGKYPTRLATTDWFGAPQPDNVQNHWTKDKPLLPASYVEYLPLEEQTIAEALKENGYATFFAGKWHLGPEGYWPKDQGFDINKGGHDRGSPPGNHYFPPYNNPTLQDGPAGEHLPDRLARETLSFIRHHQHQPFLAYLSFYSVHTPLQARPDLEAKYEQKKARLGLTDQWDSLRNNNVRQVQCHPVYAGMVEAMDLAVGKVLTYLRESELDQNTVVILMSDNGGLSTSEGHPTSNLPLKAGKGWLYEGGIREPMIIRWPGVAAGGSTTDAVVISTDFYPTMLEIARLPKMPAQHRDGMSMVPLLQGKDQDRGAIFWHYPHYGNQGGSPGSAIREGRWKLIEWFGDRPLELYDLEKDQGEENNVMEEYPEVTQRLHQTLKDWRKEVGARYPSANPVSQKSP